MEKISKVRYGQEHGRNLIKIAKKLISNQNLCKLLVNTDLDPLNPETHGEVDGMKLLHNNIKVVPYVDGMNQSSESKITILYETGAAGSNSDNETIRLNIGIYCPFDTWIITGDSLRPFAIMSEIRKTLEGVRINGLGEIAYEDFVLTVLSEEVGGYRLGFYINAFS